MAMITFFRTPKPRQFKYVPIFYDERKEALKQREQQIKQELGLSDESEPRVSYIRGKFSDYYKRNIRHKSKSNSRLIVIFIILCIIAYFLIYR
jgi:hypothetical protein